MVSKNGLFELVGQHRNSCIRRSLISIPHTQTSMLQGLYETHTLLIIRSTESSNAHESLLDSKVLDFGASVLILELECKSPFANPQVSECCITWLLFQGENYRAYACLISSKRVLLGPPKV
jgi:hypothetical protein